MKTKWIIIILILTGIAALVFGLSGQPHEFSSGDCKMCHFDEKNKPMNIKTSTTSACENCHLNLEKMQSHPTDIPPTVSIPKDMPLLDGRLTCITCHYVHPKKKKEFVKRYSFLRRNVRGSLFCGICHEIDGAGHILLESAHSGTYTVTDRTTRIDRISLQCIECHDRYLNEPLDFLGAGSWEHTSKNSHPVGISYEKASMKKMNGFLHGSMLRKELRLYDGKVGCGTCHSIYSKRQFMLVMDNRGSRLCLGCHLK